MMKYYHMTVKRDGVRFTVFTLTSSIAHFLAIEKELGRRTFVEYSREIDREEYEFAIDHGLND